VRGAQRETACVAGEAGVGCVTSAYPKSANVIAVIEVIVAASMRIVTATLVRG